MFKKIAFAGVGIVLLASPLIASADTASEIQIKIRGFLAQITQLQEQLARLTSAGSMTIACTQEAKLCPDGTAVGRTGANCEFAACPGTAIPPIGRICPQILRTLDQGITGSDVKDLQAYLGVSQTGFFGPMTARAVAAFQAEEGLSQVGIVGPMTRAAFARRCGWGNQNFTASPTSGKAPLAVTFRTTTRPSTSNGTYTVEFGDDTTGEIKSDPNAPAGICVVGAGGPCNGYHSLMTTHTYTKDGTYTAKLMYQEPFVCDAPPGAACMTVMANPKVVGTVMIKVGQAAPSCPIYSPPNCSGDEQLVGGGIGTDGCQLGPRCVPKTPTTPGAPSINGIDGPASIATGATGLWTVRASVPNNTNTQLRYSVIWGDEAVLDQIRAYGNTTAGVLQTTGTFTHAYARAGTFRPTFTVSNTLGSAQTSASVVVGGGGTDMCTAMYRVCPAGTHNGGRCDQDCIPDGTSSAFSATPTSGQAPLTVAFRAAAGDEESVSVAFGDGTSAVMGVTEGGAARGASHTYTANGTYTATLTKTSVGACSTGLCATTQVLGTVTITVGGGTSNGTFTATPKEGAAPLMVTFTGVGNNISFGDDGPTLIASGSGSLGTLTHVYRNFGTYTATSDNRSVNIIVNYDKLASFGGAGVSPNLCVYNNRTYASGTSTDVPVLSCGTFAAYRKCSGAIAQGATGPIITERYACRSGQWFDSNNIPIESELVNATSCLASDGVTAVGNGQFIAYGLGAIGFADLNAFGKRIPTMKCDNGKWLSCDAYGNNCTQASAETNTNLASALTALESAIKAFIANLGR